MEVSLRPLIETECIYDGEDDASPQVTTKEVPFSVTKKEAKAYWQPAIFLTTGNHRPPWLLTQQAACWTGVFKPTRKGRLAGYNRNCQLASRNHAKSCMPPVMYNREAE